MAFPYYSEVEKAHSELIASGQIKRRDNQEAVEHDKGLMTRRGGYYANQQDSTIGILEKTSGNNAMGYSVDLLIHKDGRFWDVASDNAGLAFPVNGEERGPDPELAKKWRQPTKELAGLDQPEVPGTTPPPTTGNIPFDNDLAVEYGLACNDVYKESGASFDAGMISVYSQRFAYDYYVNKMPKDECLQKHINGFRAEYGLLPIA